MKTTKKTGFSLLEMLLALAIFAFMFLFISQAVRQSYRHVKKIEADLGGGYALESAINLIEQDLSSIGFFLDLNDNLIRNFPIESEEEVAQQSSNPVFLSPDFVFKGESGELEFTSYSLFRSQPFKQWLKIHYFIKDCDSLDKKTSSSCLIRSASPYWSSDEVEELQDELVLLRDFESLNFSYSDSPLLDNEEWKEEWKLEESLSFSRDSKEYPQEIPFPNLVQMKIENKDSLNFNQIFSVSHAKLKEWNPYTKSFINFKKRKKPEKKSTNKALTNPNPKPTNL